MNFSKPLADFVRPNNIDEMIGQRHLIGDNGVIRKFIINNKIPSMVFWGEPGTGKTTLARCIANQVSAEMIELSAVQCSVADVRKVIDIARKAKSYGKQTILFLDEIHRFNKAQQDALLPSVENGTITLIGATTENPSFEVISALLSRLFVYRFDALKEKEVLQLLKRSVDIIKLRENVEIKFKDNALDTICKWAGGDARSALNALSHAIEFSTNKSENTIVVSKATLENALQKRLGKYDKKGEFHYDVISAFIKSMRGSDPNGTIYWLARMINAGEDPLFIARRMIIFASEDIGNANPNALLLATSCFQAIHQVGMPEGRIVLSHTATYLASSPKSNACYLAIDEALEDVKAFPERPVPYHLRNAVTKLMKNMGYGEDYKYAHDYDDAFTKQVHLPEGLEDRQYYRPTEHGSEKQIKERLKKWWGW